MPDGSKINGITNPDFINQQIEISKKAAGTNKSEGFDSDFFIKLLMTTMQNQSPFDTMDTGEILKQQSALAQVEQSTLQTKAAQDNTKALSTGLADIVNLLKDIKQSIGGGH